MNNGEKPRIGHETCGVKSGVKKWGFWIPDSHGERSKHLAKET